MGVLEGLADLSTSRNLEILPTVTAFRLGALDAAGAFAEDDIAEAGLNLKYGIASDLTADFTINPDFSQIESDLPQIDVNQRFPLFYPELRPFFLEGQEIFNVFAPITPIHTRTIVDPRYGGKVSGKVGRSSVGVLFADDEAPGKREDRSDPAFGRTANVAVGRARFDLYPESFVGATVTNRDFMDSYSRMLAFDSNMRLGATNRWNVFLSQAWHRDEEGVERVGQTMGTFFNHVGRNVNFSAFYGGTSPDFRIDTGFVRRVDDKRMFTNLAYRWWPEHWLVNWGPRVPVRAELLVRQRADGRDRRPRARFHLRAERAAGPERGAGAGALRRHRLLEVEPGLRLRHQREPAGGAGRERVLGRVDPLRRDALPRPRAARQPDRDLPAGLAAAVAVERRAQPTRGSPDQRVRSCSTSRCCGR